MAEAGDILKCMPGVTDDSAADYLLRAGKPAVVRVHIKGSFTAAIVAMADCLLQARHARALPKDR